MGEAPAMDLEARLKAAEQRAVQAEKQRDEILERTNRAVAPALEVFQTLTRAAQERADSLEAELRQTQAQLQLILANQELGLIDGGPLQDPVTQLPNNLLMDHYLNQALRSARRYNHGLGVLAVQVEDPATSDQLRAVAEKLAGGLREVDIVGCVGPGRFLLLLSQVRTDEEMGIVRKRLTSRLASLELGKRVLMGSRQFPQGAKEASSLLEGSWGSLQPVLAPPSPEPELPGPAAEPPGLEPPGEPPPPLPPKPPSGMPSRVRKPGRRLGHPTNLVQNAKEPRDWVSYLGLAPRSFDWRDRTHVEWLGDLAFWLHLMGRDLEALALCDFLSHDDLPMAEQQALRARLLAVKRAEEAAMLRRRLRVRPIGPLLTQLQQILQEIKPHEGESRSRYDERDTGLYERNCRFRLLKSLLLAMEVSPSEDSRLIALHQENLSRLQELVHLPEY